MHEFNRRKYEEFWNDLTAHLDAVKSSAGLPAVLETLEAQQFDQGFIQDDLKSVVRYRLCHPDDRSRVFTIQYNPRRAQRYAGAGRQTPPPGCVRLNNGCFLDPENIRWQQRGTEVGYELALNGTAYIAWMNPFPLMPTHVTIATKEHLPQSWFAGGERPAKRIREILSDFLDLMGQLPGFVGFYNGDGAGATLPEHFHFQVFRRPAGREPFPLEAAAFRMHRRPPAVVQDHPITALYFHGNRQEVITEATRWTERWTDLYSSTDALSANVVAALDDERHGAYHFYFIPRNRLYSRAPGLAGIVAGLEVLGELVFSTEREKRMLDAGRVDYAWVWKVLAAVEAPGVSEFLDKITGPRFAAV